MDEQIARVREVRFVDPLRVVANAAVLLQHRDEREDAEVALGVLIVAGIGMKLVEVTVGVERYGRGPPIKRLKDGVNIEVLSAGCGLGYEEVRPGDVHFGTLVGRELQELIKGRNPLAIGLHDHGL